MRRLTLPLIGGLMAAVAASAAPAAADTPRDPAAKGKLGNEQLSDERTVTRIGWPDARPQDPLGPRHDVPHHRQAALLHGGRRAGELPGAALEARRARAAVGADPHPAAAQRLQGLGAAPRAADARAHDVARDRQARAEGAAVQRRARGLDREHRDRRRRHPDAERPLLDPRAAAQPRRQRRVRPARLRHRRVLAPVGVAGRRRDRHPRHQRAGPDPRAPVARLRPRAATTRSWSSTG